MPDFCIRNAGGQVYQVQIRDTNYCCDLTTSPRSLVIRQLLVSAEDALLREVIESSRLLGTCVTESHHSRIASKSFPPLIHIKATPPASTRDTLPSPSVFCTGNVDTSSGACPSSECEEVAGSKAGLGLRRPRSTDPIMNEM